MFKIHTYLAAFKRLSRLSDPFRDQDINFPYEQIFHYVSVVYRNYVWSKNRPHYEHSRVRICF